MGSLVDWRSIDVIRLPLDSSCLVSMQPLHNAIASARLKSVLAAESQSWGLVPQGNFFSLLFIYFLFREKWDLLI